MQVLCQQENIEVVALRIGWVLRKDDLHLLNQKAIQSKRNVPTPLTIRLNVIVHLAGLHY